MMHFVTGSGGFIAKHVVKHLQGKGHQVQLLKRPFEAEVLNLTQPYNFIHLSAYGNHYDQNNYHQIVNSNIIDLITLIDKVYTPNLIKFYNISTSAIELQNQTLYSLSKHFGELIIKSWKDERMVNVRPYSVYGPGEADHRFIPTVIRALESGETILLDENAKHDWVFVGDFVNAMFAGHQNIGTGVSYSNLDIVLLLEAISGNRLKYKEAKLRSYDSEKWVCPNGVPHREIFEGLKQTYEFFTQKNIAYKQEA